MVRFEVTFLMGHFREGQGPSGSSTPIKGAKQALKVVYAEKKKIWDVLRAVHALCFTPYND